MDTPHIEDLQASFRRHLRAIGRAPRTIVLYERSIGFFREWLKARGRPETLDQMTRHAISAWLADLQELNDASTVAMRFRALRRFSRWLVSEGELEKAPTEGVDVPQRTDKPVKIVSEDEWRRLMKACARPKGKRGRFDRDIFDGRRDEVILRLLIDCGFRVSELAGITLNDVDLDRELAYVVGKGSRPRAVPFSAKTGQAIDRYLRIRSAHPRGACEALLISERGPMSPDGIRWRLERLRAIAGVPDLHPHALRHTFAHRWLANGGQERDLMHLAGWKSDAMLQVYARTTAVERAHEAHRRMRRDDGTI